MKSSQRDRKSPARNVTAAIRLGLAALVGLAGAGLAATGCLERPLCDEDCRPRTTNIFVDAVSQKSVDKIDLLFMIDNSSSMADKQAVLKDAVPDLAKRLVSPQCVHRVTGLRQGATPDDPAANCPDPDAIREFEAIKNIHIGVITSSIGGHGSATCKSRSNATPERIEMEDDRAELVGSRPRFPSKRTGGGQDPTPQGFLDWNPVVMPGQPIGPFNITFQDMTTAAGEYGCGFEAQLESIYRFLVDPAPPTEVVLGPCDGNPSAQCAILGPTNQNLLNQRAAFLRPDSLVAIVMLTDENDCSIRDGGQAYFAARQEITLAASSACAANPNDNCCYSCLTAPPSGCTADAACAAPNPDLDPPNLRCFDQKRRLGIDFLYPTQRYVNALKNTEICPDIDTLDCSNGGTRVANPLFVNASGLPRDPSLVFLAGIVGVPWQDLKALNITDSDGNVVPVPANELRYVKTSDQQMNEIWPVILSDNGGPARDALMRESIYPRGGDGPIEPGIGATGSIQAPGAAVMANPSNSHEYASSRGEDLQYSCIFQLAQPRDCTQFDRPAPVPGQPLVDLPFCDCDVTAVSDQNPLCQGNGGYSRTQVYGKAYPSLRELQVLKDFGNQSIVASICARNLRDPNAQDYGYRPAVDAIIDRLKDALTGRCLPRRLEVAADGSVPCSVIEAVPQGACDPARGRTDADDKLKAAARRRLEQQEVCGKTGQPSCSSFTLCELGRADDTCLQNVPYEGVPGWCYVDPLPIEQGGQLIGDETLVANCKNANEKRIIRFVDPDKATPAPNSRVLIACFGASLD